MLPPVDRISNVFIQSGRTKRKNTRSFDTCKDQFVYYSVLNELNVFVCFEDITTDTTAKAVAEEGAAGSFTKLTHAAEAFASHAASQAAGLFSYKKAEESKSQDCFS